MSNRIRVYCAGPLFNEKEREEMKAIAGALAEAGFDTFLPQRDGLELSRCVDALLDRGLSLADASRLMAEAIFALDVYEVLHACDALVANLNGRVPDEGTVSEAAMAWARGKPVVGYKADSRTPFSGQDNPLVSGLFSFRICDSIEAAVQDVQQLTSPRALTATRPLREEEIESHLRLGREIAAALGSRTGNGTPQSLIEQIVAIVTRRDEALA